MDHVESLFCFDLVGFVVARATAAGSAVADAVVAQKEDIGHNLG